MSDESLFSWISLHEFLVDPDSDYFLMPLEGDEKASVYNALLNQTFWIDYVKRSTKFYGK